MEIEKITKCDWPAGYQNTGLTSDRIEPNNHPKNLAFIVKKLNQVIEVVNSLMGEMKMETLILSREDFAESEYWIALCDKLEVSSDCESVSLGIVVAESH